MPAAVTLELAVSATAGGVHAVEAACSEAVESLPGETELLIAFTSGELDPQHSASALRASAPGAVTAGMSGKGVFGHRNPLDHGCAAIAFDRSVPCSIGVAREAGANLRRAGREAARSALVELAGDDGDHLLLLLFCDSRSGDIAEVIAGAYELSGPGIPLAGGAAGGENPVLYARGEALTDSVVAIGVRCHRPLGIGNAQTCTVIGAPSIVTRSDGQTILEIDGRPAEDVYLEQLGMEGERMDDEAFEEMAIVHPLSQPELHGNRRLRHVLGRAPSGGLRCATHIPANAAIEFTRLSAEALVRSGWDSVTDALEPLQGAAARAALVFDCAGRRRVLGNAQHEEVDAISESFGGADPPALAGIYTNGEVARVRGAKGDHNHAVITVAFA